MVRDEDVLRLQIPVVDSKRVAMFNGIQNLKEDALGQSILSNILTALRDVKKQISLRAILQDDVDAVRLVDDLQHGNHVVMGRRQVVQPDLAVLEGELPAIQRSPIRVELAEALDGVPQARLDVDRAIDDAIGSRSKDGGQLQLSFQASAEPGLRRQGDVTRLAGGYGRYRLLVQAPGAVHGRCRWCGISKSWDMLHVMCWSETYE